MSDECEWKRIGPVASYCVECGAIRTVSLVSARYVVTEVTGGGAPPERSIVDLDAPSESDAPSFRALLSEVSP